VSRHIPRHARWSKLGPAEYRSGSAVVRPARGAWWAWVAYSVRDEPTPGEEAPWQERCDLLGPFKRPRNAMMAAEEHARLLKRRHGGNSTIEVVGKE
jgi:hypothetical protein